MNIFLKKTQEGTIKVIAPHNEEFIQKSKNLNGIYQDEIWTFDETMEEYVKELLVETFGVDGTSPVEFCTLIVKNFTASAYRGEIQLFGRTLAIAFSPESEIKLGIGIALLDGTINIHSKPEKWNISLDNATFEIQQFPLERTKFEDVQKAIKEGWAEIKPQKRRKSKGQILTEIDFHRDKIAELEALLTEYQ